MGNYSKTPTIYQMEATECGAAALAMIFAYFGREIPLEQMRIEVGVTRDGCNAGNIMRAAKRYHLECHGYRKEPEALKTIETPCIIHWNFNHFVVFEGFKGKYAYINDPAAGRRKLTWEELDECFTGVVLTFAASENFRKGKKQNKYPQFFKTRLKGYRLPLFQVLYVGILLVFPGLILPVLSQVFMDDILMEGYYDWLTKLLVFMGACVILKFGLTWYRELVLRKLGSRLNIRSSSQFLMHMFKLPIPFFDQRSAGDLVSRMDCNDQINQFLAEEFAETVINVMVAVFYLVVLLLYSPVLTVIGLADVIISLLTVYFGNRAISTISIRLQMSAGKLYGVMCSGYGITDTIKASSAEGEYTSRVLGYQAKQVNDVQKLFRLQKLINAVPSALGKIADVMLLLVGGILIINGRLTIGMLIAYNSLFDSFCDPINRLADFIQKIQTLRANINRVDDVEHYQEDTVYTKSEKNGKLVYNGKVEFRNISFGYSPIGEPLIRNFSFSLQPGDSIAFAGPSGCGKSTVSKIASGLYHPWEGQVYLDDIPIEEISKPVLNNAIATVSQNIALFSGTVRDNLTMWRSDIQEELLDQAAKDACIYEDIMSMGGYDSLLTENAANLSGGQRQRLEIARALVTNPAVLIMDEATSALDAKTEECILGNIHRRGCTCIIVAHRLSAIRDCSEIVVMEQGKIIERGTHENLIRAYGKYYQLVVNM